METNFIAKPIKKGLLSKAKPYFGVTILISIIALFLVTPYLTRNNVNKNLEQKQAQHEVFASEYNDWKNEIGLTDKYKKIKLCLDQRQIQLLEIEKMFSDKVPTEEIYTKLGTDWNCADFR